MNEIRCNSCGKLLFKAKIIEGTIERKCECGALNTITVEPKKKAEDRGFKQLTIDEKKLHRAAS